MCKYCFRAVLFFIIFVLLFSGLTMLFVPKNNTEEAGIYEALSKAFLAEPQNTMDVFFVGDSKAYSAFIPLRMWENYGITSYVSSTGNQPTYQSYSYVKRFLRSQTPKAVVLEANCLYEEYVFGDVIGNIAEEFLPYLRYHDRWKNLHLYDLSTAVEFTNCNTAKGYRADFRADPAVTTNYMEPSEEIAEVPKWSQWYVRVLRDFCWDRNIRLYLVNTSSTLNCNYQIHNGVAQLAQQLEIPYIDTNLMPEEVPIDWNSDTFDKGNHLNYYGACKTTDFVGAMLWDTGLFTDRRTDEAYAQWNLDLEEFNNSIAQKEKALAE